MTLRLRKTKTIGWSPVKVERAFKYLKENMNSAELTNLTEYLISDGHINGICVNLMMSRIKKDLEDVIL